METIIIGGAGAGKSTEVIKKILDSNGKYGMVIHVDSNVDILKDKLIAEAEALKDIKTGIIVVCDANDNIIVKRIKDEISSKTGSKVVLVTGEEAFELKRPKLSELPKMTDFPIILKTMEYENFGNKSGKELRRERRKFNRKK